MISESASYRAAGVDITAGYKAVELMKKHVQRTNTPGVLGGLGGFGGLFQPDITGMSEPVLVSGTDGVGTKLKIAFLMDKHDTVGIDCVAMCVNDVICCGAQPLFFLEMCIRDRAYAVAMGERSPSAKNTRLSSSVRGRAIAAPAGETCLKLAAAGLPVARLRARTSCQELSASMKLM